MSVRGGNGPRDERSQAHPLKPGEPSTHRPVSPPPSRPPTSARPPASGKAGTSAKPSAAGKPAYPAPQRPDRAQTQPRPPRRRSDPHAGHGLLRFGVFVGVLAVLVGVLSLTVFRPLASAAVASWAMDNPSTWRLPLVGDFVAEQLADDLERPASDDPSEVAFEVLSGDTVAAVGDRLAAADLLSSRPAFEFAAMQDGLAEKLTAGTFTLRRDMTPTEVVNGLVENRVVMVTTKVTFREGLRLEQMTAKLQITDSKVDPREFYDIATKPPAALLADFPWLELPEGATLEGFLYPATYTLRIDDEDPTTADDLIRMLLQEFYDEVGPARMDVPAERELSFYEVLTLASVVEAEAKLDEERPLIAGVYENRRTTRPFIFNADPTVIYAVDTMQLRDLEFERWKEFSFWNPPGGALKDIAVSEDLQQYQSYQVRGMPPAPILSPTAKSIDAALAPDTEAGYFYFVLIPDSGGKHAFAKTFAEHNANLRKYGYL
jgi:UPF0755 protein